MSEPATGDTPAADAPGRPATEARTCRKCGHPFAGVRKQGPTQVYCSQACQRQAQYERAKARGIEPRPKVEPKTRQGAITKATRAREASEKAAGFVREPNPILTDREFSPDEWEFAKAIERYKRERRRPFPTWHEVLAVLESLGYRKPDPLARAGDRLAAELFDPDRRRTDTEGDT